MMTQAASHQAARASVNVGDRGLIPQPQRPSQFPIRVPVFAESGTQSLRCEVLSSTRHVLLLQSVAADASVPSLGAPVRLHVDWDVQVVEGRLAAHGVAGRFLVTVGERAIRRFRRFPANLACTVKSAHLNGPLEARIIDLSTSGARIEGTDLPVGSEFELQFTPPSRSAAINVQAFVVRTIETAAKPTLGVAFRMAQPSVDQLATRSS